MRTLIGIAAVALLAVYSALDLYRLAAAEDASAADPYKIGMQAERFRDVAAQLPAGAVVGYVSDQPSDSTVGSAMFFGAQYALAPALLTADLAGTQPAWVIGNFTKPGDLEPILRTGLRVEKDFGEGVVLFRRVESR